MPCRSKVPGHDSHYRIFRGFLNINMIVLTIATRADITAKAPQRNDSNPDEGFKSITPYNPNAISQNTTGTIVWRGPLFFIIVTRPSAAPLNKMVSATRTGISQDCSARIPTPIKTIERILKYVIDLSYQNTRNLSSSRK